MGGAPTEDPFSFASWGGNERPIPAISGRMLGEDSDKVCMLKRKNRRSVRPVVATYGRYSCITRWRSYILDLARKRAHHVHQSSRYAGSLWRSPGMEAPGTLNSVLGTMFAGHLQSGIHHLQRRSCRKQFVVWCGDCRCNSPIFHRESFRFPKGMFPPIEDASSVQMPLVAPHLHVELELSQLLNFYRLCAPSSRSPGC